MAESTTKEKVWTPTVRLTIPRPEGDIKLTWFTSRMLGHRNGCSRDVLMSTALGHKIDLKCPPRTAELVARILASSKMEAPWKLARVCHLPEGDTLLIRRDVVEGRVVVAPDTVGGTFCPAAEWWLAVIL